MKILMIDDSKTLTKLMYDFLTMRGYDCVVANDGYTGLSLIEMQNFDAVLLDLNMPEFDGEQIIDTLNKKKLIPGQKIILFTACNVDANFIEEQKRKGVFACIKKPAEPDLLEQTLRSLRKC